MSSNKEVANQAFNTAKLTAHWLSLAKVPESIEYTGYLGIDQETISRFVENYDVMKAYNPALHEIRYTAINEKIEKSGYKNILDIACGYSPRGIKFVRAGYHYIGADLPVVVKDVSDISSKIEPGVKYVVADATNPESLLSACDFDGPVCVVTEGLGMYLNKDEHNLLRKSISAVLHKYGGMWITPDPGTKALYKGVVTSVFDKSKAEIFFERIKKMYDSASDGGLATKAGYSKELSTELAKKEYLKLEFLPWIEDEKNLNVYDLLNADQTLKLQKFVKERDLACYTPIEISDDKYDTEDLVNSGAGNTKFRVFGEVKEDTLFLTLTGRVDSLSTPQVLDYIDNRKEVFKSFSIDCSDLEYISSAGLRALNILLKRTPDGKHKLHHVSKAVLDVLDITGFISLFEIE